MKKKILPIFLCLLAFPLFAQYEVKGGQGAPLLAENNINERIQVYFLNGLQNAEITFTSQSGSIQWYKFTGKATDATPIGNTSVLTDIEDGMGYYVGDPASTSTSYIWIIDYSKHVPAFNSIKVEESDDKCERIKLLIDVDADKLLYSIPKSGIPTEIFREYKLDYTTMKFNSSQSKYMSEPIEETIKGTPVELTVDSVLEDTKFQFSGDQFANYFNMGKTMTTSGYKAIAVQATVLIDSTATTAGNEISGDGISAPSDFSFNAYANEPVAVFYNWKVYNLDRSKTDPVSQSTARNLHYTFEQTGRYRVDLDVSDAQSICTYSYSASDIIISDFILKVPNAFSPNSSPGVNDVFKVAYKSIVKFNAWIFNRWGNELFHWSDPSQGWDGKYRGKFVPPGTYYYVIEAEDATGKKHVKKGDVNIVGGK